MPNATESLVSSTGFSIDAAESRAASPRRSRRAFRARLMAMFALVSVVMVAIEVIGDQAMRGYQEQSAQTTSAAMMQGRLGRALATIKDAESDLRGYVLTGRRDQLVAYLAAEQRVRTETDALAHVADGEQEPIAKLRALVRERVAQLDLTLAEYDSGGLAAAQAHMGAGVGMAQMKQIEALIDTMQAEQDRRMQQHDVFTGANATRVRVLDALAIGLCLATLGVAFWSIRREQAWRALAEIEIQHSHDDLQRSLASARMLTDRMVQMSKFGELLQGCRSVTEAAGVARAAMPAILDGCGGAIYLLNGAQNTYESVGAWGESASEFDPIFAPEDCWAIRRNQIFPPHDGAHGVSCAHAGCTHRDAHTICLPLAAQGAILGVLHLCHAKRFTTETRGIARALAEQLALALANLQLQETLRTQSIRDPLTGLFNRRYLDASLLREFTRAERRAAPVALLMIDVDHFKQFNDTHGHDAGDVVLAQIGQVLTQMSRPEDIACRYGGEELTLVMPEAPADVAMKRAEEIRTAVARMELSHRNASLGPVTISIGVAVYPQHGRTLEQVRQASDRALYAAKHAGRDRVVAAPPIAGPVVASSVVKSLVASRP